MKQGNTHINNLCNTFFVLIDVMETNLMNFDQELKKAGLELRHQDRRTYNTALKLYRLCARQPVKTRWKSSRTTDAMRI